MKSQKTDVLICGSSSAGLCAAAWLSQYGVDFQILEQEPGPLKVGKADGVQTRTVEIFSSFGIGDELLREGFHVMEVAFWGSDTSNEGSRGIKRLRFAPDKEDGISHLPHLILNQARLNELLLSRLKVGEQPQYNTEVKAVQVQSGTTGSSLGDYPVRIRALNHGKEEIWEAKYVLACDGAHSMVRRSLGFRMLGDTTEAVWGVMDIYCRTDFPDIRKKTVLSPAHGSMLIIPREGDFMVRFYIELPVGTSARSVTLENLQETARQLFHPYKLDFVETVWWSAYVIGQRIADAFHKDHKVFLTGDACHTHSPKAGQGMNVSLQDGYNIGWKLGQVLSGEADQRLLETYVSERHQTAQALIDFDTSFTKLFSSKSREINGITPEKLAAQFVQAGRFTAGQGTHYPPSSIVSTTSPEEQGLAVGLVVGMRIPNVQVVRFSDAKTFQLLDAFQSDGQWRLVVFTGNLADPHVKARLDDVSNRLGELNAKYNFRDSNAKSIIQSLLVLKMARADLQQELVPLVYTPTESQWGIKNLHNVYVDDDAYHVGYGHAFESYGVNLDQPEIILVVRPDQCTYRLLDQSRYLFHRPALGILRVLTSSMLDIAKICSFDKVDEVKELFAGFLKVRTT